MIPRRNFVAPASRRLLAFDQAETPNARHPERSPALFLSRRILAGAGRREGSAFFACAQDAKPEGRGFSPAVKVGVRKGALAPEAILFNHDHLFVN